MNTGWMLEALQDMQNFAAMNNLWDSYAAFEQAKEAVAEELIKTQTYQGKHTQSTIGINCLGQIVLPPQPDK